MTLARRGSSGLAATSSMRDRSRDRSERRHLIADGHTGGGTAVGNARILKFDKMARRQDVGERREWPRRVRCGPYPGLRFGGRLFVGDRQNNRIQIFESGRQVPRTMVPVRRPKVAFTSTHGPTRSMWPTRNRGTLEVTHRQLGLPQTGYAFIRAPNAVSGSGALAMVP